METWIAKNWYLIAVSLVSSGIVVGTIKAVLSRIDRETSKLSRAIDQLTSTVHAIQIHMVDKADCERHQSRCGSHICEKIDQVAAQLAEERSNHREDVLRLFDGIDATKDTFSKGIEALRERIDNSSKRRGP